MTLIEASQLAVTSTVRQSTREAISGTDSAVRDDTDIATYVATIEAISRTTGDVARGATDVATYWATTAAADHL